MKLHIFNTEHDLALAFGGARFTAPHAARQLRADLGFLPALMADDNDMVLVDDVDNAVNQMRYLRGELPQVQFVTPNHLPEYSDRIELICPWGWDIAICHELRKACPSLTPMIADVETLADIRQISNRRWSANNLGNTGIYCSSLTEVNEQCQTFRQFVLKAPWSCSGRGVRYRRDDRWTENVIRKQGGIMVEPYYNKVMDFAMEFSSDGCGHVSYLGISLFETVNGAYKGNLLAPEVEKMKILSKYIPQPEIIAVRQRIITRMTDYAGYSYRGPFGVDMMIYEHEGEIKLAECVELNLRTTMGHVALALTKRLNPDGTLPHQLMRVEYDGSHYHLRVLNTYNNALNTTQI